MPTGPPDDAVEIAGFGVWIDGGIICIRSMGVAATSRMVADLVAATRDLVKSAPMPVLFDFRQWVKGGSVAWEALINNALSLFSRVAFVIDAESSPTMTIYPEVISRLLVPVKVFTDEADALAFLRTQR
jgi:hypothetical protein